VSINNVFYINFHIYICWNLA